MRATTAEGKSPRDGSRADEAYVQRFQTIAAVLLIGVGLASMSSISQAQTQQRRTSLLLLLDRSGSMRQSDPACVRADAAELVLDQLSDGDRVWLAEFGTTVERLTGSDYVSILSGRRQDLSQRLHSCGARDEYTDILAALDAALARLQSPAAGAQEIFGTHVLLLTDGRYEPPPSVRRAANDELLAKAEGIRKAGAKLHCLGLGSQVDVALLAGLAERGGGVFQRAGDASELVEKLLGFARLLGRRWEIARLDLRGGLPAEARLPAWAIEWQAVHLAHPKAQVPTGWEYRRHYRVRRGRQPGEMASFPGLAGGVLLVDASGDLDLEVPNLPKRVPLGIPFDCQARLVPRAGGPIGAPSFLESAFVRLGVGNEAGEVLEDSGARGDPRRADGEFNGRCLLPADGADGVRSWRAELQVPMLDPPRKEGQLEAVAAPVSIGGEGLIRGIVQGAIARPFGLTLQNSTDVPVEGVLEVGSWRGHVALPPRSLQGKSLELAVSCPLERSAFSSQRVFANLVLDGSQRRLALGDVGIGPRWIGWLVAGLSIAALALTVVLPRRTVEGSTLVIRVSRIGEDAPEITAAATIRRDGNVTATADLPSPFVQPGRFDAVSGLWRRGVDFRPSDWLQPVFSSGGVQVGPRRYLLKRSASWRARHGAFEVTYTFSARG